MILLSRFLFLARLLFLLLGNVFRNTIVLLLLPVFRTEAQAWSAAFIWLLLSPLSHFELMNGCWTKPAGYFLIFVIMFSALPWFAFLYQQARSALALLIFPPLIFGRGPEFLPLELASYGEWSEMHSLQPGSLDQGSLFVGFSSKWWCFWI